MLDRDGVCGQEICPADPNVSTLRPTDLISLASAFLIESSSSTTKTKASESVIAPCLSVSGR